MWCHRAGISLYPKLANLFGLFYVPGDGRKEGYGDEILLGLARPVAEFVGLSGVLGRKAVFLNVPIQAPQEYVRHCKIRVEFGGTLEKGDSRGGCSSSRRNFKTGTERFA